MNSLKNTLRIFLFLISSIGLLALLPSCKRVPYIHETYIMEVDLAEFVRNTAGIYGDSMLGATLRLMETHRLQSYPHPVQRFSETVQEIGALDHVSHWFPRFAAKGSTPEQIFSQLAELYERYVDRTAVLLLARCQKPLFRNPAVETGKSKDIYLQVEQIQGAVDEARQALTNQGLLRFYETYSYQELLSALGKINESVPSYDSTQTLFDGLKFPEALLQQNPEASHSHPIHYGMAHVRLQDTAIVNWILSSKISKQLLPVDLRFAWSRKPVKIQGQQERLPIWLELIPLKLGKWGEAAMDGFYVENASATEDLNGQPCVEFELDEEGTELWAQITARNTQRCIAMVMDGYVYSAPMVSEAILGGRSQISGNFDQAEVESLAAILDAGAYPSPIRHLNWEHSEPKQ
jgi:hypothetical protein